MSKIPVLALAGLTYCYDNQAVLQDINLSVEGGLLSIIGPNGSGKTTLLRLASGLLDLQEGHIHVQGTPLKKLSNLERARRFAVIQQKQFYPFPFTCLEMVAHGRYPYRKKLNGLDDEDYEVVVQSMRMTDTLQFKDKLITELSGGEQQRVILACALAQQPGILFLDEAFSALDISYKAQFIALLKQLVQQQGLTVISIMHDLNFVYRYSDMVAILQEGQLVGCGHPHEVMKVDVIGEVFNVRVELIGRRCFSIDI